MNSPLNNSAALIGSANADSAFAGVVGSAGTDSAFAGSALVSAVSTGIPFTIAPEIFLQNCSAFTARFPEQAARLGLNRQETALQCLQTVPPEYRLVHAKAKGMEYTPTLAVNGSVVHSKYNPQEEARRILNSEFFQTEEVQHRCIFAGLGLGYLIEIIS